MTRVQLTDVTRHFGATIAVDHFEHPFRCRTLRKKRRGSADCERKQQIRPGGVTEEELGNGNSQIVRIHAHRPPGKGLGVVRQIVLEVHRAFGMAR